MTQAWYDSRKGGTMIELTKEQRQELEQKTPRARDPQTNQTYILVREEFYLKMRAIIDGYTKRAGWDDPALDVYEQYRNQPYLRR
jgi:hypothetical protein